MVGREEFRKAGEDAQRRAITLLKNDKIKANAILPLEAGKLKIYVKNIDAKVAAQYGQVVSTPKEADIAILRINTPWYPVETKTSLPAVSTTAILISKKCRKIVYSCY